MKRNRKQGMAVFIMAIFFLLPVLLPAQDVTAKVASAIRSANARELSTYFGSTIDLRVPGTEGSFSKAQSEVIVRNFFNKYPPASYSQNHQGRSNDGTQYAIGVYKSGKSIFRTYFLLKTIEGKPVIQQLKFESEED
ncbi:MAG TPA: DUF4783 domain-containing protein [Lentimicrobium sp.]|jgi:hypothetical protein|nr:DUF4783 domain-containing protein [Lentimicrobium sp.]